MRALREGAVGEVGVVGGTEEEDSFAAGGFSKHRLKVVGAWWRYALERSSDL